MIFELKNKDEYNGLQYGEYFSLQVEKNGKWEPVSNILKEFGVKAKAYSIPSERDIHWDIIYGSLAPGIYRISKRIADV